MLRGHGSTSSSSSSGRGTSSSRQGIASARLDCSSSSGLVQIIVDKQELQPLSSAFTGVTVLDSSECQKHAARGSRGVPINVLLYFCSDQQLQLHLLQPVIEGMLLVNGSSRRVGADNKALLVFGGNVNATVTEGQFTHNEAGVALVVMNEAELTVNSTLVSHHKGNRARAVLAMDDSRVAIYNSTVSNMTAAGAVVARNESRVTIERSTFSHNNYTALVSLDGDQVGGGVLQFEDNSSAVATQSQIFNTRGNVYGKTVSGLAAYNAAKVGHSTVLYSRATHQSTVRHLSSVAMVKDAAVHLRKTLQPLRQCPTSILLAVERHTHAQLQQAHATH
jgi:hypothetical protein